MLAKRKRKILIIAGTRPEMLKLAPVYRTLRAHSEDFTIRLCVTAQHRAMLDQVLSIFRITPDVDLNLMAPRQNLTELTRRILEGIHGVLQDWPCDLAIVQGDTTTTAASALAAFYDRVPVAHVEAGLRTHDPNSPWPEEINRRLTSVLSHLHFAPTDLARENLLAEGVPARAIQVTGNTIVDALLEVDRFCGDSWQPSLSLERLLNSVDSQRRLILVTCHRRESFGGPFTSVCRAIRELSLRPDVHVVFPVHPNPNVSGPAEALLKGLPNVDLLPPQPYFDFVMLMKKAYLILTDSGGVQEEAPTFDTPVLVLRDHTERPEALLAGKAKIVGTESSKIVMTVSELLEDPKTFQAMVGGENPFGDGCASERIYKTIVGTI